MRKGKEPVNKQTRASKGKTKNNSKNIAKKKITIKLSKKNIIWISIIALVILLVILIKNYTTFGLVLNKNITDKDTVKVELASSNNVIKSYLDEIFVYSSGTMYTYNRYGKVTWKETVDNTVDAEINTNSKYIQVINKDKNIVYVYKNKYESARIKVNGTICSASINANGDSTIEYTSTGSKTVLGIYDKTGKAKYNVKLSNNMIGQYVLADNCKYLAYVDENIKGISATFNINVVDLTKIDKEDQGLKTVYKGNGSMVYEIYFDGNELVCRFEDKFVKYDCSWNKTSITDFNADNVLNIDLSDNNYAYVIAKSDETYGLSINKIGKAKEKNTVLNEVPKYFIYQNGIAFVCYQKQMLMYNNFEMKIKEYDSDMVITKPTIFNDGKSVAILLSNKLTIFTI